jgi:hypothetical protein
VWEELATERGEALLREKLFKGYKATRRWRSQEDVIVRTVGKRWV